MEQRRLILIVLLALFLSFLWHDWTLEHLPPTQPSLTQSDNTLADSTEGLISSSSQENTSPSLEQSKNQTPAIIHIQTDVLDLALDANKGQFFQASLLSYPEKQGQKAPVILLNDQPLNRYLAQSDLIITGSHQPLVYQGQTSHYVLLPGQDKLVVNLTYANDSLLLIKSYTLIRGQYGISLTYHLQNKGDRPVSGYIRSFLSRMQPKSQSGGLFHVSSYTGASVSSQNSPYQKVTFKDMAQTNLQLSTMGGWAAMQEHYFLSAWVPESKANNEFYSQIQNNGLYTIGVRSPQFTLDPQSSATQTLSLYVGPELGDQLKTLAPHLDLTIDYGWLWFISEAIFWLMNKIYMVVANWGWSIILVTLLIKLAFYPLSATSYRSMARMRKIQPKLQALRDRYTDDKQKLAQETMRLYREEKANPMSGCLPVLVQIPVFIALYWVLVESVQLRQAPFIFWIHDLAAPDPYFILPILNGLLMFVQQKLNPPPPDPTQAKVMLFLPLLFVFIFINFPAGLVLYWVVNSLVSLLQQWLITRSTERESSITLVKKKPL